MRSEGTDLLTQGACVAAPRAWQGAVEKTLTLRHARPLYMPTADLVQSPFAEDTVAIAADGPVDPSVLYLPRLRIISFAGTGIWELVDTGLAAERGITVCNIHDYATDAVAEHTWALILAVAKRVVAADSAVRSQLWPHSPWGCGLSGRTLGLVGVGSIGRRVAELGRAFGMQVIAWSHRDSGSRSEPGEAPTYRTRDEVLRSSDVVSVHARFQPGAPPLLGAAEFSRLKPGAIVVNCARGGLIDTSALVASVASGTVAGAGLDVFATEPLPADSPLHGVPDIVLTPHVAAATEEAQRQAVEQCLGNIAEFFAGRPRNAVNLVGAEHAP